MHAALTSRAAGIVETWRVIHRSDVPEPGVKPCEKTYWCRCKFQASTPGTVSPRPQIVKGGALSSIALTTLLTPDGNGLQFKVSAAQQRRRPDKLARGKLFREIRFVNSVELVE